MDLPTLNQLLSAAGRDALAAAADLCPTQTKYPAAFDRLRKHFPPALARAALDTVLLREKARAKFARTDAMVFDREALEMATSEPVAQHRAARFAAFPTVADLGCGIGGDAVALALAERSVVALDRDPVRLRMAEANLAAHGLTARFVCDDVLTADLGDIDAAFADPGRRHGGRRTLSLHDSEPPVPAIVSRFPAGFPLAVKVAPGFPKDELAGFDADPEFVSLGGELKECVLWFGPLRTGAVRAAVLPGPHTLTGDPDTAADVGPVGDYLYDPDPSVTRAGLVAELARQIGGRLIEPGVGFVTADVLADTPFATAYRVEEVVPLKQVGEWLRGREVGRVTVVKRGSSEDADALVKKWKLRGDGHRAVLLTRNDNRPVAVIGHRADGLTS